MGRVSPRRRRKILRQPALAVLVVLLGLPFVAGSLLPGLGSSPAESQPMTFQVTRGVFVHDISVRGELESAINVDVRCDVRMPQGWATILEVVPEGTRVQPGDFLVRLDSSALEAELEQQKIRCEQSRAAVAAAREAFEMARSARRVYLEGEYRLAIQQADAGALLAECKVHRAGQYYQESRRLHVRGYVTARQLQADQFAVQAAKTDLEVARLKRRLLEDFTKPKRLAQIDSTLVASKARLAALEFSHELDQKMLADLREQIEKCVIRAPVAGVVVLAHLHHYGHSHMVEPGEKTYRYRTLVRLPDPRHMQVAAKIEEDKIAHVRPGLPVSIAFEAFPGVALPGHVVRINHYPEPEGWLSSGIKQYLAIVRIDKPLDGLRPRLSADLRIHVQQLDDTLQVPCQAVLEHGEKSYCILADRQRRTAREVSVGPSNGRTIVVRRGLEEGERVILASASQRGHVELPELPGALRSPSSIP